MFGLILVIHLFGAIYWMGGLLMITTLLSRVPEEVGLPRERFLGAARKLFEINTNIGAAVTIASGVLLILLHPITIRQPWLIAKLLAVAVLLFYHVRFHRRIQFLEDNPGLTTQAEYNFIHAALSLLVLVILLLSVYGAALLRFF
ncbi:MAG: CopD family protein [Candidatus Binataceae bacterium]